MQIATFLKDELKRLFTSRDQHQFEKYYPNPEQQRFVEWPDNFKLWASKFFEVYEWKYSELSRSGRRLFVFPRGILMHDWVVGEDYGLAILTFDIPRLLKWTGCPNVEELVRTIDPLEFANKRNPPMGEGDYLVQYQIRGLVCEDVFNDGRCTLPPFSIFDIQLTKPERAGDLVWNRDEKEGVQ